MSLDVPSVSFPDGSVGKESVCNARDTGNGGFNPWVRKIPWRGGHDNPFQYSCLEDTMDREAWWTVVCGVMELDMTEQQQQSAPG